MPERIRLFHKKHLMKFIPDFHESTVAAFNPFVSIPSFIIAWKKAETAKDSFSADLPKVKIPTKKSTQFLVPIRLMLLRLSIPMQPPK